MLWFGLVELGLFCVYGLLVCDEGIVFLMMIMERKEKKLEREKMVFIAFYFWFVLFLSIYDG